MRLKNYGPVAIVNGIVVLVLAVMLWKDAVEQTHQIGAVLPYFLLLMVGIPALLLLVAVTGGKGVSPVPGARQTPATLLMLIPVLLMLVLPGCWSNIELEQRAMVAGLGVDRSPNGRLLVTAQIVRPELVVHRRGAGQGGGGEEPAVFMLSAEARTVVEATRIISKDLGRDLFFPYLEVLVFGEGLAREGMEPVVDWVGRDASCTWTPGWVSPGLAREVMANTTVFFGRVPAFAIGQTISTAVEEDSRVPRIFILDFLQAAARPGQEPVAVRLSIEGAGDRKQVQAIGSAAFRGYRLAGWLTEIETRGFLWFRGHVRRGYLSGSLSGDDFAAFEIRGYEHKLTSEIREGRPVMKLKIENQGRGERGSRPHPAAGPAGDP